MKISPRNTGRIRNSWKTAFVGTVAALIFLACGRSKPLPVLGSEIDTDGKEVKHQIPEFSFVNQDSQIITYQDFTDKVYVADFFFTSCPTICPKMTKQMHRIYEKFKSDDRVALLSHSIDTKYDTVARLKNYAENLGVTAPKWHFVTGEKAEIHGIADAYFNIVIEDKTLPGGYDHSGRFILVDKDRQVRSYCNGLNEEEVDQLIKDIEKLLNEEY